MKMIKVFRKRNDFLYKGENTNVIFEYVFEIFFHIFNAFINGDLPILIFQIRIFIVVGAVVQKALMMLTTVMMLCYSYYSAFTKHNA